MNPRDSHRRPGSGSVRVKVDRADVLLPGIAYGLVFLGLGVAAFALSGMERATELSSEVLPPWAEPNAEHWFGLDARGGDLMGAVLSALGKSSVLALVASVLGVGMGGAVGVGLLLLFPRGGERGLRWARNEIVLFPALLFVVLAVGRWGGQPFVSVISLASVVALWAVGEISAWIEARALEGDVIAGRALGESRLQMVGDRLAPEILLQMMGWIAFVLPAVLLMESAIGFSGIGIGERPMVDRIGEMIAAGRPHQLDAPWLVLSPGLSLTLLLILLAALGRVVRKSLGQELPFRWF